MHAKSSTTSRHGWRSMARLGCVIVLSGTVLAGCGSRKSEDLEAEETHPTGPAKVDVVLPSGSQDAEGSTDPCQVVLKQEARIVGAGVEAEFTGQTDRGGCENEDKKPVLYMRMVDAQFKLPVQLDCQPKAKGSWNVRCSNASQLIDAKSRVRVRINADANYRSSQTGMMLTYEKP